MRPLAKTDYSRGHFKVLSVLTAVPDVSPEQYVQAFYSLKSAPNTYFTLVIVNKANDQIVGVGNVFIEQKFIRGLGKVGHIEDIAVDKNVQGRKLGLRVIQALTTISERMGAYKTILNCSDHNIRAFILDSSIAAPNNFLPAFYQKCGFEKKENEMALYHNKPASNVILTRL